MREQEKSRPLLKQRFLALVLVNIISLTAIFPVSQPVEAKAASSVETWGVFIGKCIHGNTKKVKKYKNIVIDAQFYTKKEIKKLKKGGRKVYSYLSIGSLGTYRSYYKYFRKYILGKYNNWSDEQWIDVTQKKWQNFVVERLAARYKKMGISGIWVDNTDVYYEFPTEEIFNSLVQILKRIRAKKLPVIINGGDVFVTELLRRGQHKLINGIMQEEVLTRIVDYKVGRFALQTHEDRIYFHNYCKNVKRAGLKVSLLEYTKKKYIRKYITDFCKKKGYTVYISNNVQLK